MPTPDQPAPGQPTTTPAQNAARILLGSALIFAGVGHFTFARKGFRAQVPFGSYSAFWDDYSQVSVVGEPRVDGDTVVVPLRYVRRNGEVITASNTLVVGDGVILGDQNNPV